MQPSSNPLVRLAQEAIREYVEKGRIIPVPDTLTPEMEERHGVFVSLKKGGRLRGCIGTYEPTTSCVAEEIIMNAISAATKDPRFMPVTPEELPDIEVSVDILTEPKPVQDMKELDPKRYGIIVKSGYKRGLLLPDIEGVDTVESQISIARQKAGILPDEPFEIYKFEVKRYK